MGSVSSRHAFQAGIVGGGLLELDEVADAPGDDPPGALDGVLARAAHAEHARQIARDGRLLGDDELHGAASAYRFSEGRRAKLPKVIKKLLDEVPLTIERLGIDAVLLACGSDERVGLRRDPGLGAGAGPAMKRRPFVDSIAGDARGNAC